MNVEIKQQINLKSLMLNMTDKEMLKFTRLLITEMDLLELQRLYTQLGQEITARQKADVQRKAEREANAHLTPSERLIKALGN